MGAHQSQHGLRVLRPERAPAGLLAAAVACLVSGCGSPDRATGSGGSAAGGDERTTAASLAWVTAEHLGRPTSASAETDIAEELGPGSVGAALRYRSAPGEDGDQVTVAVGRRALDELECPEGGDRGAGLRCVTTARGTVLWERRAPGEDPGNVAVGVRKGAVTVLVHQSGPEITGDPRGLHLPVTVSDMFSVAEDPRVDLTTSREAVDAGASLPYWS